MFCHFIRDAKTVQAIKIQRQNKETVHKQRKRQKERDGEDQNQNEDCRIKRWIQRFSVHSCISE